METRNDQAWVIPGIRSRSCTATGTADILAAESTDSKMKMPVYKRMCLEPIDDREHCGMVSFGITAAPAFAQIDFSGTWTPLYHEDQPERIPGPELVDYLGLPINDAARLRAESWNSSRLTLQEHQCRVHISPYIYRGPLELRVWEEKDPETQQVVAIKNFISTFKQSRSISMDRAPSYAPLRGPHLDGFFHRKVGRQYSDRLHHSH